MLPNPGEIVGGKYRIDGTIGQGGMGVVLAAFDQSLGRPVAIKFLAPERAANEAAATRFGREARAAAAIQSEHVVRVHEVGNLPSGAPFIVMEKLEGGDLASLVQNRGGLPVDYACDLVLQICEALGQAHARGIVHRDLKPQNLFLTHRSDGSPCVKVLDFGISTPSAEDTSSPKLTSTDMVMGTPLYMSPEQVRSLKNVDARADIWALGAILQELLTTSPPFDGPSASALHAAIAMDAPAPLRQRRPDVNPGVEAVVLRCLEKDPNRRFQHVGELAAAIAPFASERGRQSAGSVHAIVPLGSLPPPAGGFGMASTMDVRAPAATPRSGSNAIVQTDAPWQQGTAPSPSPQAPKSNNALIIGLAAVVVAGMVVAGVAAMLMLRSSATNTVTIEVPASAVPAATVSVPPIVSAVTVTSASAAPKASAAPAASAHHPAKDGGAPATPKDDGQARMTQQLCDHNEFLMGSLDPAARRSAAETAKSLNCYKGPGSAQCEKNVCMHACAILNDQECIATAQRGY
jgi:serine/threonine-protein kinase